MAGDELDGIGRQVAPARLIPTRWSMDAVIDVVGTEELPAIVDLYNQIFRPQRDIESFRRRYLGRYNVLQMLASVKGKPCGFFLGFELKPTTYFAWFYGVHPDF